MKTRTRAGASAAVLAAALVACGGSDAAKGPSVDELPPLLAEQLCAEVEACLDSRSLQQLFGDDGCKKRLLAQVEDSDFSYTQHAIDQGRVKYDSSKVDACLKTINGLGCDFATERALKNSTCEQVFGGTVARGGKCGVDAECEGLAFCKMTDQCPGKCAALLQAGDPCDKSDQCESGLLCSDADKTCTAPVAAGDTCGGGVGGNCAPGLSCVGEDKKMGKPGTCRKSAELFKGKLDDVCNLDRADLCTDGLSCVASLNGTQVSFKCEKPVASGEACRFGVPTPCPQGEYCDADVSTGTIDGTCRAAAKAGDACVAIAAAPACEAGLICDIDQRCHPVNRLGQPCVSDDGCASKRCSSGKCTKKPECHL